MKIGECVGRSTLKGLRLFNFSPSFQSEEAVKEWVQSVVVGGNSLIRSLESELVIFNNISFPIDEDIQAQLRSSSKKQFVSRKKSIPVIFTFFWMSLIFYLRSDQHEN